jgi:hypothetical protein
VLVAENLLLRQQVIVLSRQVKRPRLRPFDRWVLASIAGRFRDLLATILVVKPETVIRWHRAGWRLLWRWRSRRPVAAHPSTWTFATSSAVCGATTQPGART